MALCYPESKCPEIDKKHLKHHKAKNEGINRAALNKAEGLSISHLVSYSAVQSAKVRAD